MSYNEILTHIQCDEASDIVWKFCCITAHEGPLKQNHPNYKGSTYNIMIEWENGEITSEPMTLLLVPFMLRKMISLSKKAGRGSKRLPSMRRSCFEWQTKPSYVPTALPLSISMVMRYLETSPMLFRLITKWQEATKLECQSQDEYKTFEDWGYKADPPKGYKKIHVHLVFDVEHDGRHKACLVADGQAPY